MAEICALLLIDILVKPLYSIFYPSVISISLFCQDFFKNMNINIKRFSKLFVKIKIAKYLSIMIILIE